MVRINVPVFTIACGGTLPNTEVSHREGVKLKIPTVHENRKHRGLGYDASDESLASLHLGLLSILMCWSINGFTDPRRVNENEGEEGLD
jgi:hypothetical protein